MFNDFNFLNYWRTKHKIKKTRELINRIYGNYLVKLDRINKLENSIDKLKISEIGIAYIIVHCHNPEGKEIASITGVNPDNVKISINDEFIDYVPYNLATHGIPIELNSGNNTISVDFNGIHIDDKEVFLSIGQIQELIFTLDRTEYIFNYNDSKEIEKHWEWHNAPGGGHYQDSVCTYPPSLLRCRGACNSYNFTEHEDIGEAYAKIEYTLTSISFQSNLNVNITSINNPGAIVTADIYSWSGIGYLPSEYVHPPYILSQSFENWYYQHKITGNYPTVYFHNPNGYNAYIISNYRPSMSVIPANKYYTGLVFDCTDMYNSGELQCIPSIAISNNGSESKSCSGTVHYLKMSSVPYDMDGLAV